jgi:hypothetical protein
VLRMPAARLLGAHKKCRIKSLTGILTNAQFLALEVACNNTLEAFRWKERMMNRKNFTDLHSA